jgi:hypothetical protein
VAESSASITRAIIVTALRRYLQYARTGTLLTDQSSDIDAMIMIGENMFYGGTKMPGEETIHAWSFLQSVQTISVTANDASWDLPDGFGGFAAPHMEYAITGKPTNIVRIVEYSEILRMRYENPSLTSAEFLLAVAKNQKTRDQSTGQRFELQLYPTPSAALSLYVPYYLNPQIMVATTGEYPLGGQPHGMTLLEACLAAAELHINDIDQGPHWKEFMRHMADSIAFDRARTTPTHFGRNEDHSQRLRSPFRRHLASGVTYIGS